MGDFDIMFNYDGITWETGDASGGSNGFGGTPAGAGYSSGDGNFFQFPGSLEHLGLTDPELSEGSRGSQQPGRYVFPIRNGLAPGTSTLTGLVKDSNGTPQAGAPVQACFIFLLCVTTRTDATGHYQLTGMNDGFWDVTAFPPAGSHLKQTFPARSVNLTTGETTTLDLTLIGTVGLPTGTTITNRGMSDGVPVIYWNDELVLTATGCPDGQASYKITQGSTVLRSGSMTESSPGSYRGTAAALYPEHGDATVEIKITCRNGADDSTFTYDIYIDPSGKVVDSAGRPVAGATVTLLRSDDADGPFVAVPHGDAIMSPSNRVNPDVSKADGQFGWDVIAGFYKVRAEKEGCHAAGSDASFVETDAMQVPPPRLDLRLVLDCPQADSSAPVVTCAPVGSEWHAADVTVSCTAVDEGTGLRSAGDAAFTLTTDVAAGVETASASTGSRTVCDQADNCATAGPVTGIRVDRRAPSVSCPGADGAWHAANVTLSCGVADGGSGVDASSVALSTSVAAGSETANAVTDSRSVCDAVGNCAVAGPVAGNRVDRAAPRLGLPLPLTTDATAPTGVAVTFAATATDGTDADPAVACTPASGARFAIGTTTVVCTATDHAGNATTGSFTVKVNGAPEQITALTNQVLALLKLPALATPLKIQLEAASKAVIERKPALACASMDLFILAVKLVPTSALPVATRDKLVADAKRIKAVIGC